MCKRVSVCVCARACVSECVCERARSPMCLSVIQRVLITYHFAYVRSCVSHACKCTCVLSLHPIQPLNHHKGRAVAIVTATTNLDD